MIARSALPFTLRNILDRVGRISTQPPIDLTRAVLLSRWQRVIAALGDWSAVSNLAWRREILLHDRPERFRRFCRDCGEETPHEGFDEFGAGWYAQICRCRYCGEQGMKVWPLAWW
jgi:hypothetical protein